MSNLPTLLKKYEALTLEIARLGTERVTIHDHSPCSTAIGLG